MKQKILAIEFADGVQELPSSMKVQCNITGKSIHYYTPNLLRIIKNKYKNNYKYFLDNYISREGKSMIPTNLTEDHEEDLTPYRSYLLLSYNALKKEKKNSITASKMADITDIFAKRFPERSFSEDLSDICVY